MKKFCILLFVVLALVFSQSGVFGANYSLTFQWEQDDPTYQVLTKWELLVANQPGGPYTSALNINKSQAPGTGLTHTADAPLVIIGTPGAEITKYFVLVAWVGEEKSGLSNEVSHLFSIPVGDPQNFVIIEVKVTRE